ncbi:glutamate-gated chloride channel-like isoform X2 [Paramacrobiotus metropolitanus]|uniref:glutamate-gated chloride channel-like isoform X2 n=1 Tax=Paramacrobiotus metropolitanus TaxID=2943436 RepID=UPI002445F552|nr:glutamate-gated chloride channel-like isoform X2 [Paramacrobiotus metropolitanus]
MLLRSIFHLDDITMSPVAQMTLRLRWNDPRLVFNAPNHEYLTLPSPARIWKADLFFANEQSAHFHNILQPNVLTRIYPNGDVLMSLRLTLKFGCSMDLRMFPMDRQVCAIPLSSFGTTSKDVEIVWDTGDSIQPPHPIQLGFDVSMPRFRLVGV